MISYDSYKNRIEKLAKAKKTAHKFRFLIMGAVAVVLGGSVGLMVAKGAYTSDMAISAQKIEFSQDYEVKAASSFLNPASAQRIEYYSLQGDGEWTTEKPVKAGNYLARTVSPKLVGYSYSSPVEFEIIPRAAEFEIVGDSVVYGETPDCTLNNLIPGHRLDESSIKFEYADYGAASTEVNAVQGTLKIVDENGEDFTSCYKVSYSGKTLSVTERDISVKLTDKTVTYDATAQTASDTAVESTLSQLAYGDTLTVKTALTYRGTRVSEAVNAGMYGVEITSFTVMHGDKDVTARYDARLLGSVLEIERRKLTINTQGKQKVYDGTPLSWDGFTAENLVTGHEASVHSAVLPSLTDVGTLANDFRVSVFDGEGNAVTENYLQQCNGGTLEVTPCEIKVTTGDKTKIYDGTKLIESSFTLSSSPVGFTFEESYGANSPAATDAGVYDNVFDIVARLDGLDVSKNFSFEYVYGKLTINKKDLTIVTGSADKVYDGEEFGCDNPTTRGIVPSQSLKVSKDFTVLNVTGADGVDNAIRYTVIDKAGNDVGKNYNITHEDGKLIINALRISVETATDSREYDGTAFSNADYTVKRHNAGGEGLYGKDVLVPTFVTSLTDADSIANECRYELPTFDGVRSNYELVGEIRYGTLTVEPKKVTVTVNDATSVYGEEIPDNGFALDCTALPNDEKLTFDTHFEKGGMTATPDEWQGFTLLNAGSYAISATQSTAKITGGNAKINNYNFTFVSGTLEITARKIIVTTATDEKIYDGKPLKNNGYTTVWTEDETKAGLLNNDKLIEDTNNTQLNPPVAGPYDNVCYYKTPNANYEITDHKWGKLTIKPRPIIVTTADKSKTYDGTALSDESYTVKFAVQNETTGKWTADENEVGLITVDGVEDKLTLVGNPASITDAGEIKNENKFENSNYDIVDYVYGTLKVTKKRVEIKLTDLTAEYGRDDIYAALRTQGEGFVRTDGLTDNVLADGETLLVTVGIKKDGVEQPFTISGWTGEVLYRLNIGEYETFARGFTVDNGNPDETESDETLKNYEIVCGGATLKIETRKVEVDIKDGTAVYGADLSKKHYGYKFVEPDKLPYGETLSLTYKYDREVKGVGEYDILADKVLIDGKEEGLKNYEFTFNAGTLTVSPAPLNINFWYNMVSAPEHITYGKAWSYPTGAGNYKIKKDRVSGLVNGEELEMVVIIYSQELGCEVEKPVNVGKYNIKMNTTESKIYSSDGSEIIGGIDNYRIETMMGGHLSIEPKLITVTFVDNEVEYGDDLTEFKPVYTVDSDGDMPYNETFTIGTFAYYNRGNEAPEKKKAGEYEIKGEDLVFYDEDGNEIDGGERNYTIIYEGALTVNKKKVNIRLTDEEYVYGREDLLQGSTFSEYVRVDGLSEPALAYGEEMIIWTAYKKAGVALSAQIIDGNMNWRLNVGDDYTRYAVKYSIYASKEDKNRIDYGTAEELKNYEIICSEGAVKITPLKVTVKPNDNTCLYGTPEDEIENTFECTDIWAPSMSELPYGEELILTYSYDPSPLADVGDYKIIGKATGVKDGDLKNYDVSYEDGTLTIEKRAVKIKLEDKDDLVYGDKVPGVSDFNLVEDGNLVHNGTLQNGETLTVSVIYFNGEENFTPKNVGEYKVVAISYTICDAEGNVIDSGEGDALKNYEIECEDGKLKINPRKITVELNPITTPVYYGETFEYEGGMGNYANTPDLAYGESLSVAVKYSEDLGWGEYKEMTEDPKDFGLYRAALDEAACRFYENIDGVWTEIENGVKNYEITCAPIDRLRISRRDISVTALSFIDENAISYGDLGVTFNYPEGAGNYESPVGLQYGQQIEITVKYTIHGADPGKANLSAFSVPYDIEIQSEFKVYDKDGNLLEDGAKNYNLVLGDCVNGKLKINPRQVEVELLEIGPFAYGLFDLETSYPVKIGNYVNAPDFAYGEQIQVSVMYVDSNGAEYVEPKDVGKYGIGCDTFKVYNSDDEEIVGGDENYEIEWIKGELEIVQREISFQVSVKPVVYGDEIPEPDVFIASLNPPDMNFIPPYDEKITGEFVFESEIAYKRFTYGTYEPQNVVTPKNVGVYYAVPEKILVNGAENGTANYKIMVTCGSFVIGRRAINVELNPIENVTYGETFAYADGVGNYANTPDLAYEESLELVIRYYDDKGNALEGDPVNAGIYFANPDEENSRFYDKDGNLIENGHLNYAFTRVDSEVEIKKLKVDLKADNQQCVYGDVGKVEYTTTVKAKGETFTATKSFTLVYEEVVPLKYETLSYDIDLAVVTAKDCGKYAIRVSVDDEFKKNYEFTNDYGVLTVNKRTIHIELRSEEIYYGGMLTTLETDYNFKGEYTSLAYQDEVLIIALGFLTADGNPLEDAPRNVGSYIAYAKEFNFRDYTSVENPELNVSGTMRDDYSIFCDELKNYTIECECGTIKIDKRAITVTIDDKTATYGNPLPTRFSFYTDADEDGMPHNETFVLSYYYEPANLRDAGTYEEAVRGTATGVNDENGELIDGGLDNYDISYVYGTLTINPRPVTVRIENTTVKYGEKNDVKYTASGMVAGETLKLGFAFNGKAEVQNVGTYNVTVTSETVEGGKAENYEFEYSNKSPKLTISPKPVVVTISDDDYTYGERTPAPEFTLDCTLPYDEEFELTYNYTKDGDTFNAPTAAGTYSISAQIEVTGGNEAITNYDVEIEEGELVISPREITLQLNAAGKTDFAYGDDFAAALSQLEIPAGDLVDGQKIIIKIVYEKVSETTARVRFARTFAARAAEFIPSGVGTYKAVADFANSQLVDSDGNAVEGGIANYVLADGFTPDDVTFTISPMALGVTVENASVTYGDKLPESKDITFTVDKTMPNGEALKLEFAFGDGETEVKNVDKYAISISAKSIEGGNADINNYTVTLENSPELEIVQREITVGVISKNWPFGTAYSYPDEAGNCTVLNVADGEKIKISVKFYQNGAEVTAPYDAGKYDIVLDDFTVCDLSGAEIEGGKDNYKLSSDCTDGELVIDSATVVVKTFDNTKVYDGEAITHGGFEVTGTLAEGYTVVEDEKYEDQIDVTPVGGVKDQTTFKVLLNGKESNNYKIEYEYGTLTITKRPLTVTTESKSKDYDGTELKCEFDDSALSLGKGDKFTITKQASQTDAGSVSNSLEYVINNSAGKDITELNYDITENFGTLTVNKLRVTITLPNVNDLQYGEQPSKLPQFSIELPNGEEVTFDIIYKADGKSPVTVSDGELLLDVGTYETEVDETSYKVTGGNAKASNYDFFTVDGNVKIVARRIKVTTATSSSVYDGKAYSDASYETAWADGDKAGLLGTDKLTLDGDAATITDKGETSNVCAYTAPSNYLIVGYEYGKLTVTVREITVKTDDLTATYDGEEHGSFGSTVISDLKVAEGQKLVPLVKFTQTDATDETGVKNETTFKVVTDDAEEKDVSANYGIEYECGYIIVNPAEITIETGGLNETYNGKPQSNASGKVIDGTLIGAHEIKADEAAICSVTDVTAAEGVDNDTGFKVFDGSKDVSKNYKISYDYGKIIITAAEITITLNDGVSVEYGDGSYVAKLTRDAVTGLVNGEEVTSLALSYDKTPRNVATYEATPVWASSTVKRANGTAGKASNYTVAGTLESVSFDITEKEISVAFNSGVSVVYGDDTYEAKLTLDAASGTVTGETLKVAVTYEDEDGASVTEPKNAGTYKVILDWDNCTVVGGEGLLTNYKPADDNEDGEFEITPKKLSFTMKSLLDVKYGDEIEYGTGAGNYEGTDIGLVYGEQLEVIPAYEKDGVEYNPPVYAGEYEIVCGGIKLYGSDGSEIEGGDKNYDYSDYVKGTLKIEGVSLVIKRNDVEKVYDGTTLAVTGGMDEVEISFTDVDGEHNTLPDGYTLVMVKGCETETADVQEIENTAEYEVRKNGEYCGEFEITYAEDNGKLIISERTVTVKTESDSKAYDGTALTAGFALSENSEYALVEGHEFAVVSQASITDVGTTANTYVLKVVDGGDDSVNDNYVILYEDGELEVTTKAITVTIEQIEAVYGGEIKLGNVTLSEALASGTLKFGWHLEKDGERVEIVFDENGYTLVDAGTYTVVADEDSVEVVGGDAANYEFEFVNGTLVIGKREIVVETNTVDDKIYDGETLYVGGYITYLNGDDTKSGLINGDELVLDNPEELTTNGITDVGEMDNEFTFSVPGGNYDIVERIYGTLKVLPRPITILTGNVGVDEDVIYDGTEHYTEDGELIDGSMVGTHDFVADEENIRKVIDATDEFGVDNDTQFKVLDGADDVSGNYDISYEFGTIIVKPKALTVTLNKDGKTSFEYGDETMEGKLTDFTAAGLVNGETLQIAVIYDGYDSEAPKAVGSYSVELYLADSAVINGREDSIGIGNYVIECEEVNFSIVQKEITLTLGEVEGKTYDGDIYYYDEDLWSLVGDSSFAYEEELTSLTVRYFDADGKEVDYPTDAGTYKIVLDKDNSFMSTDDVLSDNYDVTCADAFVTITCATLTITLSDVEHVYDGKAFDIDDYEGTFAVDGLCGTDEVASNVTYSSANPTNFGEYTISFDLNDLTFVSGNADNYQLAASGHTLSSNLSILKREIEVGVNDRVAEKGKDEYGIDDIYSALLETGTDDGFVGDDLQNAGAKFTRTFVEDIDGAKVYEVSVEFTNAAVMNNYEIIGGAESGMLTLTDRWIEVIPTVSGEFVYDGNPVDGGAFGIEHYHLPDREENGFTAAELAAITIKFTFVNLDTDEELDSFPVDAGEYEVYVKITGADNYYIEYGTETFEIARRQVNVKIANNGGETEFVYSNSKPGYKATLDMDENGENEGFIGAAPQYEFTLEDGGVTAERFNAGTYEVAVEFEDSDNYEINVTETFEVEITRRVIVVAPVHPNGGNAMDYEGEALVLGDKDFRFLYGSAAAGDEVTIESTTLEPTRISGTVQISGVKVTDVETGEDVSDNYEKHFTRNTAYKVLPDVTVNDFRVVLEYKKMTLRYEQVAKGGTYPYTGNRITHTVSGEAVKVLNNSLYEGHEIRLRANTYTVPAAAGTTVGWLENLIRIYDANNKDVTILYDLNCTNAEDEGNPIIVSKLTLSVTLSGITAAEVTGRSTVLTEGTHYTLSPLDEGVGVEVLAFNVKGEKLIGVTVFKTVNGRRVDLSENYDVAITNNTDIPNAKLISLQEAEKLAQPVLDVTFKTTLSADDLDSGKGTVFTQGTDGNWWLNSEYYEADGLDSGHYMEIAVFRENGGWVLGVVVYSKNGNNRVDASSGYNTAQLTQFDGVTVKFVTVSSLTNAQKMLYIDFTGAFNADGTLNEALVSDGKLSGGYVCDGLSTTETHEVEVKVEDDGNGNYTFTVNVYLVRSLSGRVIKVDKSAQYSLVTITPDNASVNVNLEKIS